MEQEMYIKKLPHAEVIDLRSIITIEEQQVSSLTLVQRPSLAMTLLSLDKGSSIGGIPLRATPWSIFYQDWPASPLPTRSMT